MKNGEKIVSLKINSKQELLALHKKALENNIYSNIIGILIICNYERVNIYYSTYYNTDIEYNNNNVVCNKYKW